MNLLNDTLDYMHLHIGSHVVYVHRIRGEASLVNICRASVPTKYYVPNIEKSVKLLDKGTRDDLPTSRLLTCFSVRSVGDLQLIK